MESNSGLRDLILITHEEYISLKRQEKTPDAREKQKQHLLSKFAEATQTNFEPIEENQFKTINTAKELPEDSLVAQLNLNSRYHLGDSSTSNTVETKQSYKNPSDQVLSNLLQSGVTGGKVERSRQILKKIEDCDRRNKSNHQFRSTRHGSKCCRVSLSIASQYETIAKEISHPG